MRFAQFSQRSDRAIDFAAAAGTDRAALAAEAEADDVMDFDQSLPVPWEWWTPSVAAN